MLTEDQKQILTDSLNTITYTYNSVVSTPQVLRVYEDYPRKSDFVTVTFMPSSEVRGAGPACFLGRRTNELYSDYGYGESERCIIRTFARTSGSTHGLNIAFAWLQQIERFVRYSWEDLTSGIKILDTSFLPYQQVNAQMIEKHYIYELQFTVITQHGWSDEPTTGALGPPGLVSGVAMSVDSDTTDHPDDTLVWVTI